MMNDIGKTTAGPHLHDAQDLLPAPAAPKAVKRVGQAILMKAAWGAGHGG